MASANPTSARRLVQLGEFELDRATGELRKGEVKVRLQEQPLKILELLLEQPGELVSREQIQQRLWPDGTFVEFEHSVNAAVKRLREALGDSVDNPRFVETIPRRGYRLIVPLEKPEPSADVAPSPATLRKTTRRRWIAAAAGLAVTVAIVLGVLLYPRTARPLTEKDFILIAAFENRTGDSVFDGTLERATAIGLAQSPYLNIVPAQTVRQALVRMGRQPDERVSPEIGREICQRSSTKALLTGSIASLGSQYVLTLSVMNAATGETLADVQQEAQRKEEIIKVLGEMISRVRDRLGESLRSVQKFDKPLLQVTTGSLEALKAYSAGVEAVVNMEPLAAIPLFQRAIELDPRFAIAYGRLATAYANLGRLQQAEDMARRAFELRDRCSERERLYITARYYLGQGDILRALETYETWKQLYPAADTPYVNTGVLYNDIGENEKALQEDRKALSLISPAALLGYLNLAAHYLYLSRLEEAQAVLQEAEKRQLGAGVLYAWMGTVTYMQGNAVTAEKQWQKAVATPEGEREVRQYQAQRLLYQGRMREYRDLNKVLVREESAHGAEAEANVVARAAMMEARTGYCPRAAAQTERAMALSRSVQVLRWAALAHAACGDVKRAQDLTGEALKRHPDDTLLKFLDAPHVQALAALQRGSAKQALEVLAPVTPYDEADVWVHDTRGYAYLAGEEPVKAEQEFQRVLLRKQFSSFGLEWPLAKLGTARAQAAAGDKARARKAYEEFFKLWKDADPDIPILKQAKAEYAKL